MNLENYKKYVSKFSESIDSQKELNESDKIQIPGVGVSSYDMLKKNVQGKVQDLLKKSKKSSHSGVAESQFKILWVMWKALADYEDKK